MVKFFWVALPWCNQQRLHCLAKTKYCRNSTQLATLSSFSKLNNIKSGYCDIKSSSTTSSSATPPSQQTFLPSQPCWDIWYYFVLYRLRRLTCIVCGCLCMRCSAHIIRDIHLEIQPPCKMSSTSNNVALQASVERAQQSKASVENIFHIYHFFLQQPVDSAIYYSLEQSKVHKTCFEKIDLTFRADIAMCHLYINSHVFLRNNIFISIFKVFYDASLSYIQDNALLSQRIPFFRMAIYRTQPTL